MKKIIALFLVCLLTMSFVACSGGNDESTPTFSTESNSGGTTTPTDTESTESTDDESSTSDVEKIEVDYTNKFVSWGEYTNTNRVALVATGASSLQLSKINEVVGEGDNGVFTSAYGATIEAEGQDYANYAVAVFTYDHTKFSYMKTSVSKVGEADAKTAIPKDGFVLVIWKDNTPKINAIDNAGDTIAFFPHGFIVNNGLDTKIKAAKSTPVIDGNIGSSEYGSVVWNMNPENDLVSYIQFDADNYYATATVYMTYDASKLYIGVVVDTNAHNNISIPGTENPDAQEHPKFMHKYDCVQINIASHSSDSQYTSDNWQHKTNPTAVNENALRQYGLGVNNDGETVTYVWMPDGDASDNLEALCKYDEGKGKIYYEAAIGWSELGTDDVPFEAPVKGDKIGVSVSVNCSNTENQLKSIFLRDGGGIIGINDWTKVPTITLD